MVAHTSHHVQIHHGHNTLLVCREIDTTGIVFLHPFQELLGTDQSLFLGPEESEDDASWRTSLLKILGQFEYYGITTGIVVGTRVHPQRIRTSRTRILTSHTQMVIVRANDDVFIPQLLVLSRKHGDDVMGSPLHFFPVGEVMKVTFFLLSLDHGLELQTAKLADDIFRGEGITRSAWESAT